MRKKANKKLKYQTFIIWMNNKWDHRDDVPVKVTASSPAKAMEIAMDYEPHRFIPGTVYTIKNFKKKTGWSHTMAQKID